MLTIRKRVRNDSKTAACLEDRHEECKDLYCSCECHKEEEG